MKKEQWEQVGEVGVDSGRLTLTDYQNHPTVQFEALTERLDEEHYPSVCQIPFEAGHMGAGISVRAGLGDGVYPVYVRYEDVEGWGRRIAEVKVVFLPHPVLG